MKLRYVRPDDSLDDDEDVVVRGGDLERDLIVADAQRMFDVYGVYGISVFALRDATVDELAQQPPLARFEVLALVSAGTVRAAGLRFEPTGRNPRHFTVLLDDLGESLDRLVNCERRVWANPYYEA